MAFYTIPAFLVPLPPDEESELPAWRQRLTAFLGTLSLTLGELGDAYVTQGIQIQAGILSSSHFDAITSAAIDSASTVASETTNYRTQGAPTNSPLPNTIAVTVEDDASANYVLGWTYTQGAKQADSFLVFIHEGDAAPTLADPQFQVAVSTSVSSTTYFQITGSTQDKVWSFSVAALRRTENGLELGTLIGSSSSPDWRGVTVGTPAFLGDLVGTIGATIDASQETLFHFDGHALSTQGRRPVTDTSVTRIPDGKFGPGISLGSTTDNRLANSAFDDGLFTSWTVTEAGGGTATVELVDTFGFAAAASLYCPTSTAAVTISQVYNAGVLIETTTWTISTYIRPTQLISSGARLSLIFQDNTGATIATTSSGNFDMTDTTWRRVHLTATAPTGTYRVNANIGFGTTTSRAGRFLTTALQLEQRHFRTAYTASARSSVGSLEYSRAVLSHGAGALFGWFYVFTTAPHSVTDGARTVARISDSGATNRLHIYKQNVSTSWRAKTINGAGTETTLVGGALTEGWHSGCLSWSAAATRARLYLDGALSAEDTAANLPNSFATSAGGLYLGGTSAGDAFDARLDEWVCFRREPSVDEVYAWHHRNAPFVDPQPLSPTDIPGAPTNSPVANSASITTSNAGGDQITIGWTYTQPGFTESALPADFFLVANKIGNTTAAQTTSDGIITLPVSTLKYTLPNLYSIGWSFAVAAARRTRNNLEIGPWVSSTSAPDWTNIGGTTQIGTTAIADLNVTSPKRSAVNSDSWSYTLNHGATTQHTFTNALGRTCVCVPQSGDSGIEANVFNITTDSIYCALFSNYVPIGSVSATLVITYW